MVRLVLAAASPSQPDPLCAQHRRARRCAARPAAPPWDPKAYGDFIDVLITRFGNCFEWIELWNEPDHVSQWDRTLDPHWQTFCAMIGGAAYWAQRRGKRTLLGGLKRFDPNWLELMFAAA